MQLAAAYGKLEKFTACYKAYAEWEALGGEGWEVEAGMACAECCVGLTKEGVER